MNMLYDCILKGGVVVNHEGVGVRDIGIREGKIAFIGTLSLYNAPEIIECHGLHLFPGVIDSHVHFREPGFPKKETLESGSRAAVLGGVTSVFEMPNTFPATKCSSSLADKIERATGRMFCDFAFWVAGTKENIADIPLLERLPGVAGIKVFMGSSTGDLLVEDDEHILAILQQAQRRVSFHAEDEFRLRARIGERVAGDFVSHTIWRDPIAALEASKRLVALARKANKKIHILHISTKEEIEYLRHHKDIVSMEVTPHHLTFSLDDYARLGSFVQMNPPIRSVEHREALWFGVQNNIIDILGSDHAPHTREEKNKDYPHTPSGIPGVQTLVPIMLDYVHKGMLKIEQFVHMTSYAPHVLFHLPSKGMLSLGFDADITCVDMKRCYNIAEETQASLASWTPYAGRKVTGYPMGTIVGGRRVMWEGEICSPPLGTPLLFF